MTNIEGKEYVEFDFTSNSNSNQKSKLFLYEDKDKLINDVLEYRYPIFHKIHNKYFNKE